MKCNIQITGQRQEAHQHHFHIIPKKGFLRKQFVLSYRNTLMMILDKRHIFGTITRFIKELDLNNVLINLRHS